MLTPQLADSARAAVGARALDWLGAGIACDLLLAAGTDAAAAAAVLADHLALVPVDVAIQDSGSRRKKILIADMDSTIIDQECIDELADEVGLKQRVAEITRRSMNGEIAFEPALRERVALLADLDIAEVVDRIVGRRLTVASGARTLVATMRAGGAWTALVSGGFDVFTRRIAALVGFQEQRANHLLGDAAGRLTGKVAEPILGRDAKAAALKEIAARLALDPADALAVGDGANDLDMIRLAGLGVALHAKPIVAAQAPVKITHGDLTALLYLQGFRLDEFVG